MSDCRFPSSCGPYNVFGRLQLYGKWYSTEQVVSIGVLGGREYPQEK